MTANAQPALALTAPVEEARQAQQRIGRWMTLHPSGPLPPKAMEDAHLAMQLHSASLAPATLDQFRSRMESALNLVAAASMGEADRTAWLKSAAVTLVGIPVDLLDRGCEVARRYCDHPSKIVPTIIREIEGPWNERKRQRDELALRMAPTKRRPWEREEEPFDESTRATPEELDAIKAEFGIKAPDDRAPMADYSNLRQPTVADYLALGVPLADAEAAVAAQRPKQEQAAA